MRATGGTNLLTKDLVLERFTYRDGKIFWKSLLPGCQYNLLGKEAGNVSVTGSSLKPRHVVQFGFRSKLYRSRIVWIMHNGDIPDGFQVDHINGDQLDDRIENLRLATNRQNAQNKGVYKNNRSGVKGVGYSARHKKWQARIRVNGKLMRLGYFSKIEDAANAYQEASVRLFGDFSYYARQSVERSS